jgi:hypothetical protein
VFRVEQSFHSEAHPAGDGLGQDTIRADVRFVLEIHDIDPNNPGSLVAPSTVLYDGVISGAPAFATYVLANSSDLHCTLAFTRLLRAVGAEVRSALPDEGYRTRLVGSLADGAECLISGGTLEFFPQSVPAADELIEVRYRGTDRAQVRVTNPDIISSQRSGNDNGIRGVVLDVQSPAPRTAVDCENAALTILDDATGSAWSGTYKTWSDFLPDGADVFPGDAIHVSAPSRTADFRAIVREAHVVIKDIVGEHSEYTVNFADDASTPLAMAFASSSISDLSSVTVQTTDQIGSTFLADLTGAEISDATSTSVTIDAGITPPAGWGIEVRRSNQGWGPDNDRNLIGRFTTRTFLVPRLARVQDFFLRQYDPSARYSRYSAALHLDRPL